MPTKIEFFMPTPKDVDQCGAAIWMEVVSILQDRKINPNVVMSVAEQTRDAFEEALKEHVEK